MQKRNPRTSLPMTTQDIHSRRVTERRKRHRSSTRRRFQWAGVFLLVAALSVFALHRALGRRRSHVVEHPVDARSDDAEPLDEFPSLQYALHHSKIVLLYFAASWCPMSTPVTQLIDEKLGNFLLPPPTDTKDAPNEEQHDLSLVFVSSDHNAADMQRYYMRRNWMAVPFESEDRNNLKRHYETCAKAEMATLKIKRKREIPTLIVLAGKSRQVLTYAGVEELKEKGEQAVDHWMHLLRMSDAMKLKYQ